MNSLEESLLLLPEQTGRVIIGICFCHDINFKAQQCFKKSFLCHWTAW